MNVEILTTAKREKFIEYCKRHRTEVDESFLHDEDLNAFVPDGDNPTYVLLDHDGMIRGAASLIMDEYFRRGKKGRFRIFHSEIGDTACYELMLKALLKHTEGLDKIFNFVSLINEKMMNHMQALNFIIYRYSFLLVREDLPIPKYTLPEGYVIRPLRPGVDEEKWCSVRNPAFATLKGSETPLTPQYISKMISESDHLEGGAMILFHGEKAVGVVRGTMDDYEDEPIMCIGPLAILPEYQGKGLGRILLRAALDFSKEKGYKRTILCVNAENERAKALYLQEGFRQVEASACFDYKLK